MTTPITKTQALARCKPLLYAAVGVLSTLGALSLAHPGPAQATSPGVSLAALVARLNADEATIATLKGNPIPGPKGDKGDAGAVGAPGAPGAKGDPGADGPKGTPGRNGIDGKDGKNGRDGKDGVSPFKVSGTQNTPNALVTLSGYNLHIEDGTGSTASTSGLGNLTIGYNALRDFLGSPDVRTGSHNLILGDQNNYSSSGGLVVGRYNAITNTYATVSGGLSNTASGGLSSISGGFFNTASGDLSSVSGGQRNTAHGYLASVSGGQYNRAGGDYSSVSGGFFNTASGQSSSVSGGFGIEAKGGYDQLTGTWDGVGPTWAAANLSGH